MATASRRYSPEFRREAIALVTAERTVTEVARELGIPDKTLSMWINAERKRTIVGQDVAAGPVDPATHRAALQRIAELEQENAFLGKVSAFFASKTRT